MNNNQNQKKQYQLTIHGEVQGVFFRKTSLDLATKLQIAGWVKNNTDQTVSLLIKGSNKDCQKMIEWCKKGPKNANISNIDIIEEPASFSNTTFKII
tara:strand:+ start:2784 stop:3074 length:291 start_codon:yes stop_codon:yes gene_type:complete